MQRSAAVAALIVGRDIGAQPAAARFATGIDALYGPARQILHYTPAELLRILRVGACGVKKKPTTSSSRVVEILEGTLRTGMRVM